MLEAGIHWQILIILWGSSRFYTWSLFNTFLYLYYPAPGLINKTTQYFFHYNTDNTQINLLLELQ